jgi:SAM-dependent methyltransferase
MERSRPKFTQQDYLTLSRLSRNIDCGVEKFIAGTNEAVLDVGCGIKPYKIFFQNRSSNYVGVDLNKNSNADVVSSSERLPFKDNSFSVCVCTQVMEHVENPGALVDEILRVLKPDGFLFLSTHGTWPIHDAPNDFWRWTEFGLKKMLSSFRIRELKTCGGSISSLFQLICLYIPQKSGTVLIIAILNLFGALFDRGALSKLNTPNLASNYFVLAQKNNHR